jgi:hypothetical protein
MDRQEHRDRIERYLRKGEIEWDEGIDKPLGEALYAMSGLGFWPDFVDSVSVEQALLCHQVVELVWRKGFPEDLRM